MIFQSLILNASFSCWHLNSWKFIELLIFLIVFVSVVFFNSPNYMFQDDYF